jgi:hypothetical protein
MRWGIGPLLERGGRGPPAGGGARVPPPRPPRPTVRRAYVWAFVSLLLALSALLSAWPLFVALLYVVWRIHRGRI